MRSARSSSERGPLSAPPPAPVRRAVVPFERGAREIAGWYQADPARQVVDDKLDALMDTLAAEYGV